MQTYTCIKVDFFFFRNLKRAKHETRKLETEGKKMEERLMELKFAMNREKEERELVLVFFFQCFFSFYLRFIGLFRLL